MARDTIDTKLITDIDMLFSYMAGGEKPKTQWRIGTEHEKFPFNLNTHMPVPYEGPCGIGALLKKMQEKLSWQPIVDEGKLIGLYDTQNGGAISLEPGGQLELSGAPLKTIHESCAEVSLHLKELQTIATPLNIGFLGLGASPLWSLEETPSMPKSRYAIMASYMPKVGRLGLDMMHRTATIQVNLDYSSETDMRRKMQIGIKLQPIATALFALSPFCEGKPSGYLSWRAEIWRDTDKARTGVLPFVFSPNFGYMDYIEWALDVPMYFILRDGHYYPCLGMTFREFLKGALKGKIEQYQATMGDWINHLSTLFPEVRLKNFLEMRGADSGPCAYICALPAYWVGLLYDEEALNQAEALTKDWTYEEVRDMHLLVPKMGLKTPFRKGTILDIVRETLNIAHLGLKNRGFVDKKGEDETQFLRPLEAILAQEKTGAELLLSAYHSHWQGNIDPIFKDYAF